MSGARGSSSAAAPAAAAAAIPASARKVVQSLKEVLGHGEDEIYATLKECNMDPNETAQKLIHQDTFHEVRRKRDKKKEAPANPKDAGDPRSRSAVTYRGGRGGGRGGVSSRSSQNESNGRVRAPPPKENGNYAPPSAPDSTQPGTAVSPALANGSLHHSPSTVSATHGSWRKLSGHATMAQMLKSSNGTHGPPAATGHQLSSSGMYSSSDPVHRPLPEQRVYGMAKRDKGHQRPIGDRLAPSNSQEDQGGSPPRPQESTKSPDGSSEVLRQSSTYRSAALANGRPAFQQQSVNKTTGQNLEWKPKIVTEAAAVSGFNSVESAGTDALKAPPASDIAESEVISVSTKFQNLSARDDQQVIMPNNFQSQADLGLSFGSFGESFHSGFSSEDGLDMSGSSESSAPAKDTLHEQSPSGVETVTPDASLIEDGDIPVQRDNLASNTSASIPAAYSTSQVDITKLRSAQQYAYLQSQPSYSSGIGMGSSASLDSQEAHLQDVASVSTSMKPQFADAGASFYSPAFRPASDGDGRYAQYLASNPSAKYANGGVALPGQHLPTQEVSSSTSLSSSSTVSQPSLANSLSMPTAPQQPLPVHAYPAQPTGMPLGHFGNVFGYQYPGYTLVPSPYQHSYTASYPQPPVSSYSPSPNYAPATVKYTLPQYKPGTATANAPLSAVSGGYGGYGTASSMYAANPTAATLSTPGYEDSSAAQYKDNLYVPGPQGDGARLWQLNNDIVAAQQTSSFYALSGQNQHAAYTQPSSHTHPIAGYTSLYHHPSQPGPAGSTHQMIQQPQTLSGAAGSTQVGATAYHQQLHRMQQQQQQHQHQHQQQQQQQQSWNY